KQMNLHASHVMVKCGRRPGGNPAAGSGPVAGIPHALLHPFNYGGTDADVVTPDGTYPHVTQSESMVWGNATTIVTNYNDSRLAPGCYSGISYSTDAGTTWHPSTALCSGHGVNYGDPIVVFNANLNTWFAGDLNSTGTGGCSNNSSGA